MKSAEFNALIRAARNKDEHAVIILSKYCVAVIKRILFTKFSRLSDAEDWARDIFTYKIYSHLPETYIHFHYAWLQKITCNFMFTKLKKEKPTVEFKENLCADENFHDVIDNLFAHEVFESIDETTRIILALKACCGYSYEEIAKELGLNPATVRKKASRAKIFLKGVTIQ